MVGELTCLDDVWNDKPIDRKTLLLHCPLDGKAYTALALSAGYAKQTDTGIYTVSSEDSGLLKFTDYRATGDCENCF